jgi:hypothetical protein
VTTQLDAFLAAKKETTYGTYVAPTSPLAFIDESLEQKINYVDAQGLRPGRRTTLSTQRAVGSKSIVGDVTVEATAAEPGILFEAAFGSGTNTLLGTTAYQHLFVPAADYLPSYSIQVGIPPLGGGAVTPFSFTGMQCSALEIDAKMGAIASLKASWVGQDVVTSQSAITPVYPAVNELFTYVGGALVVGGTPTTPTTNTLSTGGTAAATVVDANIKIDNALDSGGFTLGGAGKRTRPAAALLAKITGTLTAEFRDTVFWAAYTGNTQLGLVLNFTGSLIETTYFNALQIYLPVIMLDGETPKVKAGSIITQSVQFTALQNPTLNMAYVVLRNAQAAY